MTQENISVKPEVVMGQLPKPEKPKISIKDKAKKYWPYYVMFLPCIVFLVLFSYIPMGGIIVAFKDYRLLKGIYGSPFIDPIFTHFIDLFESPNFWRAFCNTLDLFALRLVFGFPYPIFLAVLFNELKCAKYAKFVQTILFIPYFISWVVMAGMLKTIFNLNGIVNQLLQAMGFAKVDFFQTNVPFLILTILSGMLKDSGYGMIIYLAAITGIDQGLYEAVEIDGGNRGHKMWHITLPCIKSTIAIQLILSLSGILNGGLDQIYNTYSTSVYNVADIIDTYVFRNISEEVELGTALGLFKSVISLGLILISNKIAKLLGGEGIW
ncbi:MAG: sugar ABC transporter permease [Clostridiales bacterium]|nr:sugar ABC transporter permease [Clostridiales bacterium]